MPTSPASVTSLILTGAAGMLIALAVLFGAQYVGAALVTAFLHRRYPSLSERRAYLLRRTAHYRNPSLTDIQLLEKTREAGRSIALFSPAGLFMLMPSELVWRWLRPANPYDWHGHTQLLLVGTGLSLAWVTFCCPWIIACGKLAREVLQSPATPPVDPADTPPTFWPNLRSPQPE